ncbi:MAG: dihydropteroate synthase [Planctomycetaceae bacterium]|nr:dihydropteroate synthase [Planctomycetaceae bacterium]
MGILNVTPDSFSDGGSWCDVSRAVDHALALEADGADLIDVGGESTRPGAEPVDESEELRRVIPVIDRLRGQLQIPISVDTMKSRVAAEALIAGAQIVNDVSAGMFDANMAHVCANSDCGVILMHMQGTPQTMQQEPHYDDVVAEVLQFLEERMQAFVASGVSCERIVLDPGIGFGKTAAHNLSLLKAIPQLRATGRPVLIGHSRKRFLKHLLGRDVEERQAGTIGVSIALAESGADLLRVHDVRAIRDALQAWVSLRDR